MAVRAAQQPRRTEDARIIPFPGRPDGEPVREAVPVVAVVLADGTVLALGQEPGRGDAGPFATGQVSGDGWILWWQRRSFE